MKKNYQVLVVGAGYVGLATAAFFAENGYSVTVIEKRKEIIDTLKKGKLHFHEPTLKKKVISNVRRGLLKFVLPNKSNYQNSNYIFIAIDSANRTNYRMNLAPFKQIAGWIGSVKRDKYPVVILKSTNIIGFAGQFDDLLNQTEFGSNIEVVVNPEFLREGLAYDDTAKPWRVVIGGQSDKVVAELKRLYRKLYGNKVPIFSDGWKAAELIKLGSNLYLAHRLSFINEIAEYGRTEGIDINLLKEGLGSDPRIGNSYFEPGLGFGGACLPKDCHFINVSGNKLKFLSADNALLVNARIIDNLAIRLKNKFGGLKGRKISILGTAFKPETDDTRGSQAIVLAQKLARMGARVSAFDPYVDSESTTFSGFKYCKSIDDAVRATSAIIIGCAHKDFLKITPAKLAKKVKTKLVVDYFNLLRKSKWKSGGFEVW